MKFSKEFEEELKRLQDEVDHKGLKQVVGSALAVGVAMAAVMILWVIL